MSGAGVLEEDEPSFIDAHEQWEGEADDQDAGEDSFPLHRAAYYNNAARIKQLAATLSKEQLWAADPHGNNALHVAALRRATAAVEALLSAGLPVDAKSGRGWTALEEALAARDHATARALHSASLANVRLELKAKRRELLDAMRDMPDYTMKLSWRLGSGMPGLGMLLRRYAPADTYTLWKVKDRLRVDGSLMGLDTKSASLIPEWKRGHFSLIMDGSMCTARSEGGGGGTSGGGDGAAANSGGGGAAADGGGATAVATDAATAYAGQDTQSARPSDAGVGVAPRLLFLHHGKQRWVDLSADKKAMKTEERALAEDELLAALERDVDKQRFKARGFKFSPLRGWLGGDVNERVEGWDCAVYEAAGKLVGVSTSKAAWDLDDASTFDDYLALTPHEDDVAEVVFDPLNPSTYDPLGSRRRDEDEAGSDATSSGTPNSAAAQHSGSGWFTSSSSNKHAKGSGGSTSSKRGGGGWWWSRSGKDDASQALSESSDTPSGDAVEPLADAPPLGGWDHDEASGSGDEASPKQQQHMQRPRHQHGASGGTGLSRLGPGGSGGRPAHAGHHSAAAAAAAKRRQKKKAERASGGRTLRARLWMATGFPMRLSQLIPLLDVIGAANKQISKVGKFMARYADLDLFPVRIQVPLLLTVYAVVGFSAFRELGPEEAPGPEFFQVPEGYTRRLLNEMIDKHTGGIMSHGPGGRRRPYGSSSDDEGMFGGDVDWF